MLFSRRGLAGKTRRENIVLGLRLRSNDASQASPRKPSGRRVFCFWASLSHPSQPAPGMLRMLRLAQKQNPQPQHHSQFFRQALNETLVASIVVKMETPLMSRVPSSLSRCKISSLSCRTSRRVIASPGPVSRTCHRAKSFSVSI
jgi:hypothetical protein